ncbi:hypothetical protein LCGC14_0609610 [marine sediment metagenome]|uniref:Uncharacterized protein n=1 Tax=marine sediment metagenome TaxID=412755 RepID=A0A0F9RCS0_9ZZZZ
MSDRWKYLGKENITFSGAGVSEVATLPNHTEIFSIVAEGTVVLFEINGSLANLDSAGYIPSNSGQAIGPLSNLNSLHVYGVTISGIAHIQYYRDTS